MSVEIRPIEQDDIQRCAELFALAFAAPPYENHWDQEVAEEKLTKLWRIDPPYCLCACASGPMVGAVFARLDHWWVGECVVVEELFVHPEYQRVGVGSSLMATIEKQARDRGAKGMWLVANRQAAAYPFYEQQGFRRPPDVALLLKDFTE